MLSSDSNEDRGITSRTSIIRFQFLTRVLGDEAGPREYRSEGLPAGYHVVTGARAEGPGARDRQAALL